MKDDLEYEPLEDTDGEPEIAIEPPGAVHQYQVTEQQIQKALVKASKRQVTSEKILQAAREIMATVAHGEEIPTERLEAMLQARRDETVFGFMVAELNSCIEREGFRLSARGLNGRAYRVIPANEAVNEVKRFNRFARRLLARSVSYGQAVVQKHAAQLTDVEQRELSEEVEVSLLRYVLISRVR